MSKTKLHYGWVIVLACCILSMFVMVFYANTYSYYQLPVSEDLNITYTQFTLGNTFATIGGMVFSLFFSGKFAAGKTRLYMLIAAIVNGGCLALIGSITEVWQLYILKFVGDFAYGALAYIPINMLIGNWFVEKKSLATAIVFSCSNIGGMVFVNLINSWIANDGWRWSIRWSGLICVAAGVLATLLIRKAPAEMGLTPYDRKSKRQMAKEAQAEQVVDERDTWPGISKAQAVKTAAFVLVGVFAICAGMTSAGIFTMIPTFLGENQLDATGPFAVFSATGIVSQILISPMFEKKTVIGCGFCSLLGVISMVMLIMSPSVHVLPYFACCIMSFALVASNLAPPQMIGRLFGYKEFGGIYGLYNFFFTAGCMLGPIFSAAIRDATGSFSAAWIAYMVVFIGMTAAAFLAMGAGKKVREQHPQGD